MMNDKQLAALRKAATVLAAIQANWEESDSTVPLHPGAMILDSEDEITEAVAEASDALLENFEKEINPKKR